MTFEKWKFFIDYRKEEKWINEMAEKGYFLVRYTFGRYTFEKGKPGEYEYRMELLSEHPKSQNSQDYLSFMADSEIECVDTFYRWAYFRKKTTSEPFYIYSDYPSRMRHMNRVSGLILAISLLNLFCAALNLFLASIHVNAISQVVGTANGIVFIVSFLIYLNYRKSFKALQLERYIHE